MKRWIDDAKQVYTRVYIVHTNTYKYSYLSRLNEFINEVTLKTEKPEIIYTKIHLHNNCIAYAWNTWRIHIYTVHTNAQARARAHDNKNPFMIHDTRINI